MSKYNDVDQCCQYCHKWFTGAGIKRHIIACKKRFNKKWKKYGDCFWSNKKGAEKIGEMFVLMKEGE